MAAHRLMDYTRTVRPVLYRDRILPRIRPHSMESVLKIFENHLIRGVPDLHETFNRNSEAIPEFVWAFVKHLKFPVPGDAHGIHRTCRVTKADTQQALDSKHLSSRADDSATEFNVDRDILHELAQFSLQKHVFEFSNRRRYATVYLRTLSPKQAADLLGPEACVLTRGGPRNKGRNFEGEFRYLSTFKYIVVEDRGSVKILYQSLRDLYFVLRRLSPLEIAAFSDVRCLFKKCGIASHFFNMMELVERQLFAGDGSVYEKDVRFVIKYQCAYGFPCPLTRSGLAKCPSKTPLEILSFEAPKQNFSRLSTATGNEWFDVRSSADKIFFGQQFNEGVGYSFALMPKMQNEDDSKKS